MFFAWPLDALLTDNHTGPSGKALLQTGNIGVRMAKRTGDEEGIIGKIGINRNVHNHRCIGQADQAQELGNGYFIRGSHGMRPFTLDTCEQLAGASRGVRDPLSLFYRLLAKVQVV